MRTLKKRTVSIAFALALATLGGGAGAQSPPVPEPPPGAPKNGNPPTESTTPPPGPGSESDKPKEPLSKELKENEGVLEPPKSLDNGIVREAPVPDPGTTPVIPPPGSREGNPNIKPK